MTAISDMLAGATAAKMDSSLVYICNGDRRNQPRSGHECRNRFYLRIYMKQILPWMALQNSEILLKIYITEKLEILKLKVIRIGRVQFSVHLDSRRHSRRDGNLLW